ncbi:hypothetical protein [Streptomyces sp. NRRL F-5135]|uniref:hypothetical protein n=1 Tax=Streptomyces sp. NRRL F-5135 TaxID=1463858 RepID=UPI0004CBCB1E|nr:hypothetical protein [Streptomyces sp. NRRL F-5135]
MQARTPARSHPAALPWWSFALPALAFVALLTLMTATGGPGGSTGDDPAVGRVLERIQLTLAG